MISLDAWLHHVPWTSRVSMQFSHLSASILESSLDFHYLSNELLFLSELEEFSRRSPLLGLSSLSQCRFLSSPFCNKLLLLFIYKTVSQWICLLRFGLRTTFMFLILTLVEIILSFSCILQKHILDWKNPSNLSWLFEKSNQKKKKY